MDLSQPENKGNIEENRINSWVGRREIGREEGGRDRERQGMRETGREEKKKREKFLVSLFFEPLYLNYA